MGLLLERAGDVTVAVLKAEYLDGNTSRDFNERLATLPGDANRLVLDLGQVLFLDSTGCGALLSARKRLRGAGGDLKVCSLTSPVRALFDLVRMNRLIGVYRTRDEAVAAFAP